MPGRPLDGLMERWESGRLRLKGGAGGHRDGDPDAAQPDADRWVTRTGTLQVEQCPGIAATAIVEAYRQLVSVERAFWTLTSFLRVRLVFHFF